MKSNIEEARKEMEASSLHEAKKKDLLALDVRNANKGLCIKSREAYMRAWFTFAQYLGSTPFMEATAEQIDGFFYRLRKGEFSNWKFSHQNRDEAL